ncbi:hypothetical protein C8J57DRAFT_1635744 [Mycena rebaudengoi]|nr:hypothetical protein C8J57DRAFT_1635744 [Mycena rebaudengoi]
MAGCCLGNGVLIVARRPRPVRRVALSEQHILRILGRVVPICRLVSPASRRVIRIPSASSEKIHPAGYRAHRVAYRAHRARGGCRDVSSAARGFYLHLRAVCTSRGVSSASLAPPYPSLPRRSFPSPGLRNAYHPAPIVSGVLDSLSAGVLIYPGLVQVRVLSSGAPRAREFLFNEEVINASNARLAYVIGAMLSGCALMAVLGRWA